MESNNSIEELIIRYLQNEIQEDELRVLDAWIHEKMCIRDSSYPARTVL